MTEFTEKELETYLESLSDEYRPVWSRIHPWNDGEINTPWGPVKYVDYRSGGGDGSYVSLIIMVDDRLFRKEGVYSSWDDTYWGEGDFEEVESFVKTITVKDYRSVEYRRGND